MVVFLVLITRCKARWGAGWYVFSQLVTLYIYTLKKKKNKNIVLYIHTVVIYSSGNIYIAGGLWEHL